MSTQPVFHATTPGPALRDIGTHFPESLEHEDPGVRFLAVTGLFPVSMPPRYFDLEFLGGTSRFAAVQAE